MISSPDYLGILIIGLFGSAHCIGMCGGFVGMYSLRKSAAQPALSHHLLYNLGRITTYSLLGGTLGSIGSFAVYAGEHRVIPGIVLLLAGFIMVLMGLDIAGILGKRGLFERTGITDAVFFRRVLFRIRSLQSMAGTFLLGLMLGLLPCGLLYPILLHASSSGGFLPGALTAAVFGLGTVPAMMSFGYVVSRIQPHLRLLLYRVAAALIILLGMRMILRGLAFNSWIPAGRFW
ncbi:MAG: sulfite exporter TauE/SafE family protein [Nitrospirae bacterium]|nr:sulfite exporter TauE/SafE family protein [Nitrospirota bacterium]NTW64936.1 sulfite exporter TauE/SafE family protein [Nitrospirota bacterium]